MKKVIIIGGGQVGAYLANLLIEKKCEVLIVENRPSVLERLYQEFDAKLIIKGDGSDTQILEKAQIFESDTVAVVTGSDEVNLVAATIAKYEYGIGRVIARVNNPKNDWLFTIEMGVDKKVNQADLLGHFVFDEML